MSTTILPRNDLEVKAFEVSVGREFNMCRWTWKEEWWPDYADERLPTKEEQWKEEEKQTEKVKVVMMDNMDELIFETWKIMARQGMYFQEFLQLKMQS